MPKVIDEKGMLFGKVNIIDFLAIVFVISLTPMFYFGWKIHTKPKVEIQVNWEEKHKEALIRCEQRRTQDLEDWQKRYDETIKENKVLQEKIDNFLKEHKRAIKYFK